MPHHMEPRDPTTHTRPAAKASDRKPAVARRPPRRPSTASCTLHGMGRDRVSFEELATRVRFLAEA